MTNKTLTLYIGDFNVNNFPFDLYLNINIKASKNKRIKHITATTYLPYLYLIYNPMTELADYIFSPLMLFNIYIYDKHAFKTKCNVNLDNNLLSDSIIYLDLFQFIPKLERKKLTNEESEKFRGFGKRCLRLLFSKLYDIFKLPLDTQVVIEVDGHISTYEQHEKRKQELIQYIDDVESIIKKEEKMELVKYYNRNFGFNLLKMTNDNTINMINKLENLINTNDYLDN
jgi:hypothetical protein